MTCTCVEWQSTGIPCLHTIAIILFRKENPQTYAQAFLSLDAYRKTYENAIFPLEANPGNDTPVIFGQPSVNKNLNIILPPHARRQPVRPKTQRIRSGVEGPFEGKRAKRCGRCKQLGHAATTCDASI